MAFYQQYLATWPDYFMGTTAPGSERLTGYVMGKAEGEGERWHGHVTAVTVSPDYRRLGYAQQLMHFLEVISEKVYNGYFVDLYVRKSNDVAIGMYRKLGYSIYREVIGYYSGEENAYDMRKALQRDVHKKSIIPLPHPVHPGKFD
jgi:N-terminal acetyltransferase B complex catalytic subunit